MVFYKACPVVADFPSPLFLSYHHHLPFPLQLLSSHGKLPRPGRSWYMILSALHYSLGHQRSLLIAIRRSSCYRFLAISLRTSTIHIAHSSRSPTETLIQHRSRPTTLLQLTGLAPTHTEPTHPSNPSTENIPHISELPSEVVIRYPIFLHSYMGSSVSEWFVL